MKVARHVFSLVRIQQVGEFPFSQVAHIHYIDKLLSTLNPRGKWQ